MTQPSEHDVGVCPTCGATMIFEARDELRCRRCKSVRKVLPLDREIRNHSAEELEAIPGIRRPEEVLAFMHTCRDCGGVTQDSALALPCRYCGAPLVVNATETGLIVPDGVLPFLVDRETAREILRDWVLTAKYAVKELKEVTEPEALSGAYLPFWLIDADSTVYPPTYDGTSPHESVSIRTVGLEASNSPLKLYLRTVRQFERKAQYLEEVRPYRPEYLLGHRAPRYELDPAATLAEYEESLGQVANNKTSYFRSPERVVHENVRFRLFYFPVWVGSYIYQGEQKRVLLGGDDGSIGGAYPRNRIKVGLARLTAWIAGLILFGLAASPIVASVVFVHPLSYSIWLALAVLIVELAIAIAVVLWLVRREPSSHRFRNSFRNKEVVAAENRLSARKQQWV